MPLKKTIQDALAHRRETHIPGISGLLGMYVVGIIVFFILSYTGSPADMRQYQFASEKGSVTALSSIFLAMTGAFSGVAYHFSKRRIGHNSIFWLVATVGFLFLSFDELMRMHELVGWLTEKTIGPPVLFRNWNDLLLVGYGVVAIVTIFCFLPEILRNPYFAEILVVAFGFFVLHTLVDSLAEPPTTNSFILEESAKLLCSASLSLAAFVGLLSVIGEHGLSDTP